VHYPQGWWRSRRSMSFKNTRRFTPVCRARASSDAKSIMSCWFALSQSSYRAGSLTTGGATDDARRKLKPHAHQLNTRRHRRFNTRLSSPVPRLLSDRCANPIFSSHGPHRQSAGGLEPVYRWVRNAVHRFEIPPLWGL
jgi:hypothetical protein